MGRRLDRKVAIVTGSGRGIGRAIAQVFAQEGAQVIVVDIDETGGRKTAEEIRGLGSEAIFVEADVSKPDDMNEMARTTVERCGRIDILCNNAGIYPLVRLVDMTEADWDRVYAVNLKGTFLAVKACLPPMLSQRYGRIVITSSTTGPKTAIPGLAHYAATKAGINGFIRAAAIELAKYNITINGVEPGNILTEGMKGQPQEYVRAQEESIPMGRLGDPQDVAYAMLFLASDEAKFITGQTIVVDGGQILPESKLAIS